MNQASSRGELMSAQSLAPWNTFLLPTPSVHYSIKPTTYVVGFAVGLWPEHGLYRSNRGGGLRGLAIRAIPLPKPVTKRNHIDLQWFSQSILGCILAIGDVNITATQPTCSHQMCRNQVSRMLLKLLILVEQSIVQVSAPIILTIGSHINSYPTTEI